MCADTMKFTFSNTFIVSHKFRYVVHSFSLSSRKFPLLLFTSHLSQLSFSRELFSRLSVAFVVVEI